LGLIEGGNPMQMRIAFFPAEEPVAELSEDVVQEQLLGTLKQSRDSQEHISALTIHPVEQFP